MSRSRWSHHKQTKLTWLTVCLLVLMQIQLLPNFSVTLNQSDVITSRGDLPAGRQEQSEVQANYGKLPLAFEPNQGQVDGGAQFLVHHGQATTYFDGANTTTAVGDSHVTMSLDGDNTPNFTGTDQLESKTNYFIGNDQSQWHSDVPNFKSLIAKNVYPGIDLKYYGTNSQLEHDFIVSPGSDYKQIAFHFDGQEHLSLDADGNLILKAGENDLKLNAPTTYQQTANTRHTIPSQFEVNNNTVTIALNTKYDNTRPLIIDPVLVYSTYLGGSGSDVGSNITTDASGNVYLIGTTNSTNFPTASPFQGTKGAVEDVLITKLNPTGSALIFSTYLGGSGGIADDIGRGIAVDSSGNIYLTGWTNSTDFPTSSPYQLDQVGTDAFIAKLNPAGSALIYSTYLGGSSGTGTDVGIGISIDNSGNAYIIGETGSFNFPTSSPFQGTKGTTKDAFITKLNPTGSALVYSTFLGGNGNDTGYGIANDNSGNAYVTGITNSTNFPTASPYQLDQVGADAFVAKLNPAGSALVYSTYLGGSGTDNSYAIAVDTNNNAYISGLTSSTNFPTASPFQASNGGGSYDSFITKLNAAGSALTYSTYLGGSGDDYGIGIAIDSSGSAYVSGTTNSTNFPTASPVQGSNGGGLFDDFVTKLNPAGSALTYSTYLGGSGDDQGAGIAISLSGNAFVVGKTSSTNFPTSSPFQASNGGGTYDVFVTQLSENTVTVSGVANPILTFTLSTSTCDFGHLSATQTKSCVHTITAGTNATNGYVISYIPGATLTSGAQTITAMTSQAASVLGTKQFGLNLKANTAAGSFTAADFGADPSGGVGVALANYNTANQFKFITTGENIAQSTTPSANTAYTISYIANISTLTAAGTYSTLMTYNIVASY